tara:strand:- start:10074 stop:10295 length:222 start_codon:yes stop_codon:yes gene_type:complete
MAKRILDKARKDYYRRQRLEMPRWILGFIGLVVLLTGILYNVKVVTIIGVLILAIAGYLVIMGRMARNTIFRK